MKLMWRVLVQQIGHPNILLYFFQGLNKGSMRLRRNSAANLEQNYPQLKFIVCSLMCIVPTSSLKRWRLSQGQKTILEGSLSVFHLLTHARAKLVFIYTIYIILFKLMYISLLMGVDGTFYLHSATLCYTILALFCRFSMRKCIWSEQNV